MQSQAPLLLHFSLPLQSITFTSPAKDQSKAFLGGWSSFGAKGKDSRFGFHLRCQSVLTTQIEEHMDMFQNGLSEMKWNEVEKHDLEGETVQVNALNKMDEFVDLIRSMFVSIGDGVISSSAYDTAWVGLVENIHGSGSGGDSTTPQFPSSLKWIANNQLSDGSWGDSYIFSAHDRILSTLACVIALKSWNIHPDKSEKGLSFVKENISKLGDENAEHMPIAFEVAFPSLIEMSKKLGIEIPDDSNILQEIYAKRNLKLTRIPKDIMHKVPTTLLHSLEGMQGLKWKKLLKLQSSDGSFLSSPASTAYALMQTKDENCLKYLNTVVGRFNGGVPSVYPVDLFARNWAIDRLQRLGISRYFQSEIKECIDYVYSNWTESGICWARNLPFQDLDDTAIAFRLLRLHGHKVSADVFQHFRNGSVFFCIAGQSTEAVTGMFNLYRASQVLFPGEKILEDARKFSSKFLRQKQDSTALLDKWIITKDLPGEVGYALELPWYASLPRLETRFYIEQYGGEDDVWIGKVLYRNNINNNAYLELAKLDYNNCQSLHQIEWNSMQKWYRQCSLEEFGISTKSLLFAYFIASASIFEPERSKERLAWTKSTILIDMVVSYFNKEGTSIEQIQAFTSEFKNRTSTLDQGYNAGHGLIETLIGTLKKISSEVLAAHGRDISHQLHQVWEMWLSRLHRKGNKYEGKAEVLVCTINLCSGLLVSENILSHSEYKRLSYLINRLCQQLHEFQNKVHYRDSCKTDHEKNITTVQIESDMQELVQLVLQKSSDGNGINLEIKQTFLTLAKSFYYTAFSDPAKVDFHITKLLFDRVLS